MEVPDKPFTGRRRIYEEEKAKIEADGAGQARDYISPETIHRNYARIEPVLLSRYLDYRYYLFNKLKKISGSAFMAAQSIVVFGSLWTVGLVEYIIGHFFSVVLSIIGFVVVILDGQSYNGERFKVAWAGDLA